MGYEVLGWGTSEQWDDRLSGEGDGRMCWWVMGVCVGGGCLCLFCSPCLVSGGEVHLVYIRVVCSSCGDAALACILCVSRSRRCYLLLRLSL